MLIRFKLQIEAIIRNMLQTDKVRQKYTGYQKDEETKLDFAGSENVSE